MTSLRRGACPTLIHPMPTGDGLLARLAPLAAGFSPFELRALAEAAARHGNGILEVTLRGNLQIRGLFEASALELAAELDALGLKFRSGPAVETGPLAGLDPAEVADPHPLARRLAASIAGRTDGLGPKVSVIVDGGGRLNLSDLAADFRLDAIGGAKGTHWSLALAGTAQTATPLAELDEDSACGAATSLLLALAEHGPTARAGDLLKDESLLQRVFSSSPPSALLSLCRRAGISPTRGEIRGGQVVRLPSVLHVLAEAPELPISPLVGEMFGRTEGGVRATNGPVGPFELRDGSWALGVALPFGQIAAEKLSALCNALVGAREIRLAPKHGLLALGLTIVGVTRHRDAAEHLGLITDPADPRLRVTACAGAPACGSAVTTTKDLAAALAASLPSGTDARAHVSGCAKRCGAPVGAWQVTGESPDLMTIAPPSRPAQVVAGNEASAAFRRLIEAAGAEEAPAEAAE